MQLLVTKSDRENYKQIKADLDELRLLVEKSELWVYKSKHDRSRKKKDDDDDEGKHKSKSKAKLVGRDQHSRYIQAQGLQLQLKCKKTKLIATKIFLWGYFSI